MEKSKNNDNNKNNENNETNKTEGVCTDSEKNELTYKIGDEFFKHAPKPAPVSVGLKIGNFSSNVFEKILYALRTYLFLPFILAESKYFGIPISNVLYNGRSKQGPRVFLQDEKEDNDKMKELESEMENEKLQKKMNSNVKKGGGKIRIVKKKYKGGNRIIKKISSTFPNVMKEMNDTLLGNKLDERKYFQYILSTFKYVNYKKEPLENFLSENFDNIKTIVISLKVIELIKKLSKTVAIDNIVLQSIIDRHKDKLKKIADEEKKQDKEDEELEEENNKLKGSQEEESNNLKEQKGGNPVTGIMNKIKDSLNSAVSKEVEPVTDKIEPTRCGSDPMELGKAATYVGLTQAPVDPTAVAANKDYDDIKKHFGQAADYGDDIINYYVPKVFYNVNKYLQIFEESKIGDMYSKVFEILVSKEIISLLDSVDKPTKSKFNDLMETLKEDKYIKESYDDLFLFMENEIKIDQTAFDEKITDETAYYIYYISKMLEIVDITPILKRNMLLLLQNPPENKNKNNENYNWKVYNEALSNLTSNKNTNNNNNLSGGKKKRLNRKKPTYKTKRRSKKGKRRTKKIIKRRKN